MVARSDASSCRVDRLGDQHVSEADGIAAPNEQVVVERFTEPADEPALGSEHLDQHALVDETASGGDGAGDGEGVLGQALRPGQQDIGQPIVDRPPRPLRRPRRAPPPATGCLRTARRWLLQRWGAPVPTRLWISVATSAAPSRGSGTRVTS